MTSELCLFDEVHFQNGDFLTFFFLKNNVYIYFVSSFCECLDLIPGYSLLGTRKSGIRTEEIFIIE